MSKYEISKLWGILCEFEITLWRLGFVDYYHDWDGDKMTEFCEKYGSNSDE